ncbi:MAG: ankyrin repeat domain-containing protein [Phycisphaerae bacterium]|nr:ankyrin repeat domain-containing protein [Phycisphaerae bacterium]
MAIYKPKADGVAYAWAEIEMDDPGPCMLGIASNDAMKVWLNGKLVHENWTTRAVRPDDDLVAADFRAGRNHLLIKTKSGRDFWGFACRRVDPNGLGDKLLPAVKRGDTSMVKLCLSCGVDVDKTDEQGFTALQLARMRGQEAMVQLLLDQGADPNIEMPAAGTPTGFLEILWDTLQENYPMMEYAGAFDDSWHDSCKEALKDMTSLYQALPVMDKMLVQRLNDYHTSLHWEGKAILVTPPLRVGLVEDQIVVIQSPEDHNMLCGDILLEIDAVAAKERFDNVLAQAFGATRYAKTRSACREILQGEPGSHLELKLRNQQGEIYEVVLNRGGSGGSGAQASVISSRVIHETIGYLKIRAWGGFSAEAFDEALEPMRDNPYLILDVRDNGGGADELAAQVIGRFITQKVLCSVSFQRQAGTNTYEKLVHFAEPRGPWCYEGRVAVLTNAGCASACEHFVSGMLEAGALLVGTPTTGACGWSKGIDLPGGIATLRCSLTFPIHGKMPSPLHGIEPHYLVTPTIKDIRAGRDTVLEKAIALLNSDQSYSQATGLSTLDSAITPLPTLLITLVGHFVVAVSTPSSTL